MIVSNVRNGVWSCVPCCESLDAPTKFSPKALFLKDSAPSKYHPPCNWEKHLYIRTKEISFLVIIRMHDLHKTILNSSFITKM